MNEPKYQIAIRCPSCNRKGAAMANARDCPKCKCQFQAIAAGEQPADLEQLRKLYEAIRHVRDQRGDDRCWKDWEAVYALLPEGYTPPLRDESLELELCKQYIRSCHDPKVSYTSPQIRIAELEAEVASLKFLPSDSQIEKRVKEMEDRYPLLVAEAHRYQQLAAEADAAKGGLTILIELASHGGGRGTLRVTGPTQGLEDNLAKDIVGLLESYFESVQARYPIPPLYRHALDDDGETAFRSLDEVEAGAVADVALIVEESGQ